MIMMQKLGNGLKINKLSQKGSKLRTMLMIMCGKVIEHSWSFPLNQILANRLMQALKEQDISDSHLALSEKFAIKFIF